MLLRNDHTREIFVPTVGGAGSLWQVGEIKEIDDVYRLDPVVNGEIVKGTLTVLGYDPDPGSEFVHDEGAAAGAGGAHVIQIQEGQHSTGSLVFKTASSIVLDFDKLTATPVEFLWSQNEVPGGGDSAEVRLWNQTDGSAIVTTTGITTVGVKTAPIGGLPAGKKLVQLQHRVTGGSQSEIEGGTIHLGS